MSCLMLRWPREPTAPWNMAEAAYGSIHAVVNNAGVTARQPALDQDEHAWDRLLAQWIDEPVGTGQT